MKNFIYTAFSFLMLCYPDSIRAQCHLNNLQSTAYLTGQCGGYSFQSAVGSLSRIAGSCGDLFFTPPLTGSDFSSFTAETNVFTLQIYPNPAMDYLSIKGLKDPESCTGEIYSSTGKWLLRKEFLHEDNPVSISELLPGLYFIKIYQSDKQMVVRKFIKI